ncbi:uncharacterized protein LOC130448286 [Diorhabda sublineata]|uniref:uncharacterized protein LOC130448286 n=1 Tax=Diorhabda sublineata TaxID=1163346 RepID=UPI0024E1795A|nr:uncharacterized protein LOC130448286 [Diorhabda sublineata]
MSDLRQASREFLLEFIELYRNSTCLWQTKSKDYSDRNKKDLAYAELVKKYQEIDPKADRSTVVKKINSFRTVYKREQNKINNSLKSGAGSDEVYKPNLWYFEHLHFLNDVEPADAAVEEETTLTEDTSEQPDMSPMNVPQTSRAPFSRPTKRKLNPFEKASLETMQKVGEKISFYKADDCFDRFGKHVADRLRDAKPHQQKIAQKLISDVLFEADMESLTRF